MILKELLSERNLTTALIVDDGYDDVPRAQDLLILSAAWENFFADITEEDEEKIKGAFEDYADTDGQALRSSDEFVATIWKLRKELRPELGDTLFQEYDQSKQLDKDFLNKLEGLLSEIGIGSIHSGRDVPSSARSAQIIFADLFLGSTQSDLDIDASLKQLKILLSGREAAPPLVVLMSRSPRLSDKKAYFRDNANLLGALFRVSKKDDLVSEGGLNRILMQLAVHHEDALRLAKFLHAWNVGLGQARDRFLKTIRQLDLADYTQVRDLLLNFEGQPLGSYILEVYDRMLQHEIESDVNTIQAAKELSRIQPESYPPPYIAGSPNLQQLVYQTIYQHPKRLDVPTNESGAPVSFGDILIKRSSLTKSAEVVTVTAAEATSVVAESDVLVILSPPCDLVREFKRALIISGSLKPFRPTEWVSNKGAKTPIIILPDGQHMWIQWDLKDFFTTNRNELDAWLGEGGQYQILIRLREAHATELQQKLLANLGRVGLIARMPATFPVIVEAYTVDTGLNLQKINLPTLLQEGGVCYTGRDIEGKPNSRLSMSQAAVDELTLAVSNINKAQVHNSAHETLDRAQSASAHLASLHIPSDKKVLSPLTILEKDADGKPEERVIGLVCRNPDDGILASPLTGNNRKHGAFVLVIRDQ